MGDDLDLSVVVPTHNRAASLAQLLDGLSRQDFEGDWEVLVVANACTDETPRVVGEFATRVPGLRVVETPVPSASRARNAGAREATGTRVLFLDDDVRPNTDVVRLHAAGRGWVNGWTLLHPDILATPVGAYYDHLYPRELTEDLSGIGSANLSAPRGEFLAIGGYDEALAGAAGEDNILHMKMRRAGVLLSSNPDIRVLHDDSSLRRGIVGLAERQRRAARNVGRLVQQMGDDAPFAGVHHGWIRGSRFAYWVARTLARMAEVLRFPPRLLWVTYRAATATAIARGVREQGR